MKPEIKNPCLAGRQANSEFSILNSQITLGFSPCPNDTFIFDAMVHGKIDTEGLLFDYVLNDVEQLNQRAFREEIDVAKLSYFAYAFVSDKYQLLNSGSALGYKCGPLLISKRKMNPTEINNCTIAIPGIFTTANFLMSMAFPEAVNKKEFLFSKIEEAVLNDVVDAGVIIHENRFTYSQKGLVKLIDLGQNWEEKTKLPIPLGGIAVKRSMPEELKQKLNRVLRKSVEFAFANPRSSYDFIRKHAQEMNDEVMYKHIELYVNKFSIDIGEEGKNAIDAMYRLAMEKKIIPRILQDIFV